MRKALFLAWCLAFARPTLGLAQEKTPKSAPVPIGIHGGTPFTGSLGSPGFIGGSSACPAGMTGCFGFNPHPHRPPFGSLGSPTFIGGTPTCAGFIGMTGCFGSPPGHPHTHIPPHFMCPATLGCMGTFHPGSFGGPSTPFLVGPKGGLPSLYPSVLGGCLGCPVTFQHPAPQQFFTGWTRFPDRAFFHRNHYVPRRSDYLELTWIFYPDRPGFFFLFNPEAKVFLGKHRLGVRAEMCFSPLLPEDRRATLAEIPDRVYRQWGPMPRLWDLGFGGSLVLRRPPEDLPGEALPPDEPLGKER